MYQVLFNSEVSTAFFAISSIDDDFLFILKVRPIPARMDLIHSNGSAELVIVLNRWHDYGIYIYKSDFSCTVRFDLQRVRFSFKSAKYFRIRALRIVSGEICDILFF